MPASHPPTPFHPPPHEAPPARFFFREGEEAKKRGEEAAPCRESSMRGAGITVTDETVAPPPRVKTRGGMGAGG